jgi:transposase InsO family protein
VSAPPANVSEAGSASVVDSTFQQSTALQYSVEDQPELREIVYEQQREMDRRGPISEMILSVHDGEYRNSDNQLYVPAARFLRVRLTIVAHCGAAGHRGTATTLYNLQQHFFWPTMQRDVKHFCTTCLHCMRTRGGLTVPRPLLQSVTATRPNQVLQFDYIYVRELPVGSEHSFKYVFVLMDVFSRFCTLTACEHADSDTAAAAMIQWFAQHGVVREWFSDHGTHFDCELMSRLRVLLGAEHNFSPAWSPWSNGKVERVGLEFRKVLSAMISNGKWDQNDWPYVLPAVNSVLNTTPSRVLAGLTPIQLFSGRDTTSPLDVIVINRLHEPVSVNITQPDLLASAEQLRDTLSKYIGRAAAQVARKQPVRPGTVEVNFGIGDYVLVARHEPKKDKTATIWVGPARVVSVDHHRQFVVENLITGKQKSYHPAFMKRFADKDLFMSPELLAYVADNDKGYEIDRILRHRNRDGEWQLLIQWKGLDESESSWERMRTVAETAPVAVRGYVRLVQSASERKLLQAVLAQKAQRQRK